MLDEKHKQSDLYTAARFTNSITIQIECLYLNLSINHIYLANHLFLEESCCCQREFAVSIYIFPIIVLCLMVCVWEQPKGALGGARDTKFGSLESLVKRMSVEDIVLQGSW